MVVDENVDRLALKSPTLFTPGILTAVILCSFLHSASFWSVQSPRLGPYSLLRAIRT